MLSRIWLGKKKLGKTSNFDKQDIIDFTNQLKVLSSFLLYKLNPWPHLFSMYLLIFILEVLDL